MNLQTALEWKKQRDLGCRKVWVDDEPMPTVSSAHLFSKSRKIVVERSKGVCESCGKKAVEVHHKDRDRDNNEVENLIHLCKTCHSKAHMLLRLNPSYRPKPGERISLKPILYRKYG